MSWRGLSLNTHPLPRSRCWPLRDMMQLPSCASPKEDPCSSIRVDVELAEKQPFLGEGHQSLMALPLSAQRFAFLNAFGTGHVYAARISLSSEYLRIQFGMCCCLTLKGVLLDMGLSSGPHDAIVTPWGRLIHAEDRDALDQ